MFLSWVRLEGDLFQDLQWRQIRIVGYPFSCRGFVEIKIDGIEVRLGHIEEVVAVVLVSAVAPGAVEAASC